MSIAATRKTKIIFDPTDWGNMESLMRLHGDSSFPFEGKNEDGERTLISIFPDVIVVETFQHNGWIRTNTYYKEDHIKEERFSK